jgi:hypothetical protein
MQFTDSFGRSVRKEVADYAADQTLDTHSARRRARVAGRDHPSCDAGEIKKAMRRVGINRPRSNLASRIRRFMGVFLPEDRFSAAVVLSTVETLSILRGGALHHGSFLEGKSWECCAK